MNGAFLRRNRFIDSMVCGSNPCIKSITRIATSHNDDPLFLKLVNDSCPGVSITKSPGNFKSNGFFACMAFVCNARVSFGKCVAPICCVIPPASPSCTFVFLILSSSFVLPKTNLNINHTSFGTVSTLLPVSTWPMMTDIAALRLSGDR